MSQLSKNYNQDGVIIIGAANLYTQGSNYWTTGNANLHSTAGTATPLTSNQFSHRAYGGDHLVTFVDGNVFRTEPVIINDNGNLTDWKVLT